MFNKSQTLPGGHSIEIGDKVFIQTMTTYWSGVVVDQTIDWIVLKNVSWVADVGLLGDAMTGSKPFATCQHIEPDVRVRIQVGTIVTLMDFPWALPNNLPSKIRTLEHIKDPDFKRFLPKPVVQQIADGKKKSKKDAVDAEVIDD